MKLLVAGDDPIVRKGFHEIVRARPDWVVVAEATSILEMMDYFRREPFDVAVLDIPFDQSSGLDLIARIRREFATLPVAILSAYPESHYAMAFLRAGANAFLPRTTQTSEILNAISAIAGGGRYVTAALAAEVARSAGKGGAKQPDERLSARELEVFRFLAVGKSPTEIAGMLHLSVKTVSTYRARILEKTGFRSNADIVSYAIRNKLV